MHDYTRKSDVQHSEIIAPDGAPEWMRDRSALWNGAESAERRKDAQVAREVQLALPRELTAEQQVGLIREFAWEQFVARGMVADVSVHQHHARDGGEQPHAHVMLTMREIAGDGFGNKAREWNSAELLTDWRERWAEHANQRLAEAGVEARIDHRTLVAQREEVAAFAAAEPQGERRDALEVRVAEMDREPPPYLRASWYMEQKAEQAAEAAGRAYAPVTERGQWLADVKALAEERLTQLRETVAQVVGRVREVAQRVFGAKADPQTAQERSQEAVERWREAKVSEAPRQPRTAQERALEAVQRWREQAGQPEQVKPEGPTPQPRPQHDYDNSLE